MLDFEQAAAEHWWNNAGNHETSTPERIVVTTKPNAKLFSLRIGGLRLGSFYLRDARGYSIEQLKTHVLRVDGNDPDAALEHIARFGSVLYNTGSVVVVAEADCFNRLRESFSAQSKAS